MSGLEPRTPGRARVVQIDPPTEDAERLWKKLAELAVEFGEDDEWCLVGGLMVQLHSYEHGSDSRPTADIDVLGNARSRPSMTKRLAEVLKRLGAEMARPPATDPSTGYRFELDGELVEVLGSDGLSQDPETLPSYKTIQVDGGTQALNRTEKVRISVAGGDPVVVRRPTLLGAILLKARALAKVRGRLSEHREDLIRLLSLVDDPRELVSKEKPTAKQKQWLRAVEKDLDWDLPNVAGSLSPGDVARARQTFELLVS